MKELRFESNGSKWLLVDYDNYGRVIHPAIEYLEVCRLKNITEEQASEVMDEFEYHPISCKDQLVFLIKSKGIHLFNNPYNGWKNTDDFDDAEEKTFYNPILFKIF